MCTYLLTCIFVICRVSYFKTNTRNVALTLALDFLNIYALQCINVFDIRLMNRGAQLASSETNVNYFDFTPPYREH